MKPKIELGKEYPTRGGGKAVVYRDDGNGKWPYIGALYTAPGWNAAQWTVSGARFDDEQNPSDILLPRTVLVPVEVPPDAKNVHHEVFCGGDVEVVFYRDAGNCRESIPIDDWIASLEGEK